MPRLTCPDCDEVFGLPAGKRAARCPACGARVGPDTRDDEDEDDDREELRERRPRRKKSRRRRPEPIRGLIPLILLGPVGIVLAVWAPFSGYGTALAMLLGAFLLLAAAVALTVRYYRDPELVERVEHVPERLRHIAVLVDCIPAAFAMPRRVGAWVMLLALGFAATTSGIVGATVFKRMDEPPGNQAGPDNPPRQGPQPPPAEPPPPKEDDDTVTAKALAELEKRDRVSIGLDRLTKVRPNPQRRAEVLAKALPLIDDKDGIVQVKAAEAYAAWAGPDEVPTLLKLIVPGNPPGVRGAAYAGLRRLKDPRAIPVLVDQMADWLEARAVLVEYGPEAEPPLLKYLDPQVDRKWQEPAVGLLKQIGTERSVPHLQKLARLSDPYRAKPAQEALDAINARLNGQTPPK